VRSETRGVKFENQRPPKLIIRKL